MVNNTHLQSEKCLSFGWQIIWCIYSTASTLLVSWGFPVFKLNNQIGLGLFLRIVV